MDPDPSAHLAVSHVAVVSSHSQGLEGLCLTRIGSVCSMSGESGDVGTLLGF